jgi:endonuclease V-like protein UPF0215 family
MKPEVRTVGFDDGPFDFDDGDVPVVGVVMRGHSYVEAVLHDEVAVDGADATDTLASALDRSRYLDGLEAVLVDGVALGGFNVVDLTRLSEEVDKPVVSVTRGEPDREDIRDVLRSHFDDWQDRMAVIDDHWPHPVDLGDATVSVHAVGMDDDEIPELLATTTARGLLPEPLRLAHLVSTALLEGESSGQA